MFSLLSKVKLNYLFYYLRFLNKKLKYLKFNLYNFLIFKRGNNIIDKKKIFKPVAF